MSKTDWTNKLKDQLADYQEPVSHDLWAGIEQSLAHTKYPAASARIVAIKRWSAAAAAVALLGVGGSYVYLHQESAQQQGNKPIAVDANPSEAANPNISEAANPNTSEAVLLAEAHPVMSGHSVVVGSHPVMPSHSVVVDSHPAMSSHSVVESDASSLSSPVECAEEAPLATIAANDSKPVAVSDVDSKPMNTNKKDVAKKTSFPSESPALLASTSHQKMTLTANVFAENVMGSGGNLASNDYMVASSPVEGGMVDHGALLAALAPMMKSPKYSKAKHHAPLAMGVQVGVGLVPRLSLNTGIVYTRVASDFKSYGVSDYNIHQVLHYVGVPLTVNYEVWGTGGFHAYVMGGAEVDFNVKNDTENGGQKEEQTQRDRAQFSAKASLGAQYDITPQVGLYVEPGARYYFDNGSLLENTFKDKKWNFNFQFGLRINLKDF